MKAVMKSVSPRICEKVANGDCTILVSKTAPKCEMPFKCYIYCTSAKPYLYKEANPPFELFLDSELYKGKGYDDRLFSSKVIGEFVCDWITKITPSCDIDGCVNQYTHGYPAILGDNDCLSFNDMKAYLGNKKGYDWHISDLKIYDKPKELSEFKKTKERIARTCGMQARNGLCRAIDHEELCDNIKCCFKTPCPPQSWCYIES